MRREEHAPAVELRFVQHRRALLERIRARRCGTGARCRRGRARGTCASGGCRAGGRSCRRGVQCRGFHRDRFLGLDEDDGERAGIGILLDQDFSEEGLRQSPRKRAGGSGGARELNDVPPEEVDVTACRQSGRLRNERADELDLVTCRTGHVHRKDGAPLGEARTDPDVDRRRRR